MTLATEPKLMDSIISAARARGSQFLGSIRDVPVTGLPDPELIRSHLTERYGFQRPVPVDDLIEDVCDMLERWAVHVVHPRYFGYFNPTPLEEAVAADLLTAIYNPQLAVWSHAPAAVEMEQHVLRWLTRKLGLPVETTAAQFTSGGSEANLTAVTAALTKHLPGYGRTGLRGQPFQPIIYLSAGAHDSFIKIGHLTGIGRDALRVIPVDASFRMDPSALRQQVAEDRAAGYKPALVSATAGTTAAGVIDPLDEIAGICEEVDAWFHVDAAWGGAAVLDPRLVGYLKGIEAADSVTCDAHKWFNATMGAGMFFCREGSVLEETFRVTTDYMPDVSRGSVDPFATSVQWSRRFIGLKLFMAVASLGEDGYARMIRHQAEVGDYMRGELAGAGWIHLSETPLPVCCVTHPVFEATESALDRVLDSVLARGRVWISKVSLGETQALRACVTSRLASTEDVDVLLAELESAVAAVQRD